MHGGNATAVHLKEVVIFTKANFKIINIKPLFSQFQNTLFKMTNTTYFEFV